MDCVAGAPVFVIKALVNLDKCKGNVFDGSLTKRVVAFKFGICRLATNVTVFPESQLGGEWRPKAKAADILLHVNLYFYVGADSLRPGDEEGLFGSEV